MYDVVALGELLVDLTAVSKSERGDDVFVAEPGGAPCNMLAMLAKLGKKTAFIGKVGRDAFGERLAQTIADVGIDAAGLVYDEKVPTTLAVVQLTPGGERSFAFYRDPGADVMLTRAEARFELLEKTKVFHFGTLSMTADPVRAATLEAIKAAKKAGALVSFDPNLRPPLWKSMDDAKREIELGLTLCDILKIADNELYLVAGEDCPLDSWDVEDGLNTLDERYGIGLIFATLGSKGSVCRHKGRTFYCKCDDRVKPINSTGAGDTFFGAALSQIVGEGTAVPDLDALEPGNILETMKFANTAAGIVITRHGALQVMPSQGEIEAAMDYDA
jgi:fructokinase